jgi:hypothetical protein
MLQAVESLWLRVALVVVAVAHRRLAPSCTAKSPEAFVFLSNQVRHLRRSNFNRRVWQPAIRAAGSRVCVCTNYATRLAPWRLTPAARCAR